MDCFATLAMTQGLDCHADKSARNNEVESALPRHIRNDRDSKLELVNLINGLFNPSVLLDFIRFFITYENVKFLDKNGYAQSKIIKKIAAYHQYYAVNKAILSVQKAMSADCHADKSTCNATSKKVA